MWVGKVLIFLLATANVSKVFSNEQVFGTCGCAMERLDSFHESRIPSMITEWSCLQAGSICGAGLKRAPASAVSIRIVCIFPQPDLFVSCKQCRQLNGLLDVGYTRMIEGVSTVVHRRNVTIKTGCFCMPVSMQRVEQNESNIGHAQVHMHNISGP